MVSERLSFDPQCPSLNLSLEPQSCSILHVCIRVADHSLLTLSRSCKVCACELPPGGGGAESEPRFSVGAAAATDGVRNAADVPRRFRHEDGHHRGHRGAVPRVGAAAPCRGRDASSRGGRRARPRGHRLSGPGPRAAEARGSRADRAAQGTASLLQGQRPVPRNFENPQKC